MTSGRGFGNYNYGGSGSFAGEEELEEARERVKNYEDAMRRFNTAPAPHAAVVSVKTGGGKSSVILAAGSSVLEVPMPVAGFAKDLKVGSIVKCLGESMAIMEIVDNPDHIGEVVTVRDSSNGFAEIDYKGSVKRVRYESGMTLESGDRVIVDGTGSVITKNLGKNESKFSFTGETGVSWDDIGGLEQAKSDLQEAVELPFKHAELYKSYGKKPARGVMLYGPPGCGKTLLAKAVATSMNTIHGKEAAATGFVYVKGPELLDKFIGQTEFQIRALFARTRDHFKKNGTPAVLFIDEADALLGKRGARLNMGTETTVVPQFLSEMDGLHDSGCIVLLATNRPDTLDPAVTREGRVDIKVRVTRPEKKDIGEIIRLNLRGKPISSESSVEKIVDAGVESLSSTDNVLYEIHLKDKSTKKFTLASLMSGAMVSTVLDKATTLALREDMESKKVSGLQPRHLEGAVKAILKQNLHTNHDEALEDFCEEFRDQVIDVRRPNGEKSRIIRLS